LESNKSNKILILCLILFTILAVSATAGAIYSSNSKKINNTIRRY